MTTKRELRERIEELQWDLGRARDERDAWYKATKELAELVKEMIRKGIIPDVVVTAGFVDENKVSDYCNCPCRERYAT